jgi:hypothetical protein
MTQMNGNAGFHVANFMFSRPNDDPQAPSIRSSINSRQTTNGPMPMSPLMLDLDHDHASTPMPDLGQECVRQRAKQRDVLANSI